MRDVDDCDRTRLSWATRGQPLIGIAIWTPIALFGAAQHAYESDVGLATWIGLVALGASNIAIVVAQLRRRSPMPQLWGVQAAATLAVTAIDASDWYTLYCLLAIAASIALHARWALAAVAATTITWGVVDTYAGAPWSELWVTTLCLALAGLGTFVFVRLIATITELNAARDALARSAVSAERERFSSDLHDVLGHSLSLIVVKAQAVRRLLPEDGDAAAEHATDIESIGRQALHDVRETVRGYRDTTFDAEVDRARDALRSANVALRVETPALPVARGQDALLGWAVREATTNVLRHSEGSHCTIELRRHDDLIVLRVGDDGAPVRDVDVARDRTSSDGTGLTSLRERFSAAGGDLDARPGDRGFTVTATLPATTAVRS